MRRTPNFEISEVQVFPVRPQDGLIAFASCILGGQIYIGNLGVYTKPDGSGIRLVFPVKTLPNGLTISCVHPICREAGSAITEAVAKKMRELFSRCGDPKNADRELLERHQLHPIP